MFVYDEGYVLYVRGRLSSRLVEVACAWSAAVHRSHRLRLRVHLHASNSAIGHGYARDALRCATIALLIKHTIGVTEVGSVERCVDRLPRSEIGACPLSTKEYVALTLCTVAWLRGQECRGTYDRGSLPPVRDGTSICAYMA